MDQREWVRSFDRRCTENWSLRVEIFRFPRRGLRDLENLPHHLLMTRASPSTSRLTFRWGWKQLITCIQTKFQPGKDGTETKRAGSQGHGREEEEVQCELLEGWDRRWPRSNEECASSLLQRNSPSNQSKVPLKRAPWL